MWQWLVEHWEFIFGVLGVIGVVVSIVAWMQQRQPKQLDYEVRSKVRVLGSHADEWRGQFYFSYRDIPIDDPWVSIVRIRNTGKKSISQHDFSSGEPITLMSPSTLVDRQLMDASNDLSPREVAEINEYEDDRDAEFPVLITPKLLNPREWFDVQVISDGGPGELRVTARFVDQTRPMKRIDEESPERRRKSTILATTIAGTGLLFLLLAILVAPGAMLDAANDKVSLLEASPVAAIFTLLAMGVFGFGLALLILRTNRD